MFYLPYIQPVQVDGHIRTGYPGGPSSGGAGGAGRTGGAGWTLTYGGGDGGGGGRVVVEAKLAELGEH